MELFLAFKSDVVLDLERAALHDKPEEAARLTQGIERGTRILESWVLRSGGRVVAEAGGDIMLQMPSEYLDELPDIVRQVEEAQEARVAVGVGTETSEAHVALKVATKRGGDPAIVLYTPDLANEVDEEEEGESSIVDDEQPEKDPNSPRRLLTEDQLRQYGMAKAQFNDPAQPREATRIMQGDLSPGHAAPSAPPSASVPSGTPGLGPESASAAGQPQQPPGAPENEDQLRQAIGGVLQDVKQQLPFFEQQVKQANPEAYHAMMGLVQAVIELARHVSEGGAGEAPPPEAQQAPVQKSQPGRGSLREVEPEPGKPLPNEDELRKLLADAKKSIMEKGERPAAWEVDFQEFGYGFRHEQAEHPHLSPKDAAVVTLQHLGEDPVYYSRIFAEKETDPKLKSWYQKRLKDPTLVPLGKDEARPAAHHHLSLPVGSVEHRRVKVVEPSTGKVSWHQVSMGRKLSGDGHALSPRVTECPQADTPETRQAQMQNKTGPAASPAKGPAQG